MSTQVLHLSLDSYERDSLHPAAKCLREGGFVIFPTETVYGIGVNLDRKDSVQKLLEIRKSPAPNLSDPDSEG